MDMDEKAKSKQDWFLKFSDFFYYLPALIGKIIMAFGGGLRDFFFKAFPFLQAVIFKLVNFTLLTMLMLTIIAIACLLWTPDQFWIFINNLVGNSPPTP